MTLFKAYRAATRATGVLTGICLGLIAVLIPLDMALRAVGLGNLPWLSEAVEYAMFTGVFLSAPWLLAENAHVRVELLGDVLSRRAAARLERVLCLLGALVCLALVWVAWLGGRDALEFDAMVRRYLTVPEWWLYSVFGVAMALLAVEFGLRLFDIGRQASEQ